MSVAASLIDCDVKKWQRQTSICFDLCLLYRRAEQRQCWLGCCFGAKGSYKTNVVPLTNDRGFHDYVFVLNDLRMASDLGRRIWNRYWC